MPTMPSTPDELRAARSILINRRRRALKRDDATMASALTESITILNAELARLAKLDQVRQA